MPIDSRIYLEQVGTQSKPVESFQRGMGIREMMDKKSREKEEREAMKGAVKYNEDGSMALDGSGLKQLSSVSPEKAMLLKQQFEERDYTNQAKKLEVAKRNLDMTATLLGGVTDQNSWTQARQRAIDMGIPEADKQPEMFDPNYHKTLLMGTLSQKERLEHGLREREVKAKELEAAKGPKAADPLVTELREQRIEDAKRKAQEQRDAFKTPYGEALTVDDAKKLKSAEETKSNFDRKIDELIQLRTDWGGEVINREAVARGQQLSKDLLLLYKDLAKLGVLSQSDENILNQIIPPDPLEYRSPLSAATGQDPILHTLKKFKGDSEADFQTRLKTRLKNAPTEVAEAQAKPKTFKTNEIEW